MKHTRRTWIAFLALSAILTLTAFTFRHSILRNHIQDDAYRPWSIFSTEAAVHYYFTDQLYRHGWQAFTTLANDSRIVYPAVSNDWETETIAMEFLPALLSRSNLFPTLTESIFFSTNIYYSLKFFLIFFLMFLVSGSLSLSFILSLITMVSFHSYARSLVGFYLREDFGMLWILLSVILFLHGHERKSLWRVIVAALCAVIAINSWHFASFVYLPVIFMASWIYLSDMNLFSSKKYLIAIAVIVVGAVLLPMSRFNRVYASPFLIAAALFGLAITNHRIRDFVVTKKKTFLTGIFILALLAGQFLIGENSGHVLGTTWEKISHFGVKPDDPRKISFLTRLYWEGDFSSPTAREWFKDFWIFVLLGVVVFILARLAKQKIARPDIKILFLLLIGTGISLIARRNLMIAILMVAVASALLLKERWPLLSRAQQVVICAISCTTVLFLPWGESTVTMAKSRDPHVDRLISWMNEGPNRGAAIAGHFSKLPTLLAFTGASITSHSKFENLLVRTRAEEFYEAMYGPPALLVDYLQRMKVPLLLVNLNYFRPDKMYDGGVSSTEGSALSRLAEQLRWGYADPHFKLALDLTPWADYAVFSFEADAKQVLRQ